MAYRDGARFVQYTRLMRYPDTVDLEVIPVGENQSTLALYSRSLVGRKDFGVNRARLRRWRNRASVICQRRGIKLGERWCA